MAKVKYINMKNRINKILKKYGIIDNKDLETISEEIEFDFIEYTNFINTNYKSFAGDWIRLLDDKIIYNPLEILEDFVNSRIS